MSIKKINSNEEKKINGGLTYSRSIYQYQTENQEEELVENENWCIDSWETVKLIKAGYEFKFDEQKQIIDISDKRGNKASFDNLKNVLFKQ